MDDHLEAPPRRGGVDDRGVSRNDAVRLEPADPTKTRSRREPHLRGQLLVREPAIPLGDVEGLDFVLTALFVVFAMDAFHARPDLRTVALAGVAAGIAVAVRPESMVLAAMTAFAAALVVRHHLHRRASRA